jgi:hypothetical protein
MVRPHHAAAAATIVASVFVFARPALAHHEALFGPQSSLAVESQGFASAQVFVHAYGINGQETPETTMIASAGVSPFRDVPLGFTLIQPFTYQTARNPTPAGSSGPFSACDGCFRMENTLVAAQYRFDFTGLQRAFGKDGNFALVSAALEVPTGSKDYSPFQGPFDAIFAGMVGVEKGAWSSVALGYYRRNTPDFTSSKKGDNALVALGAAFTPIDEDGRMLSFQLGVGYEHHLRDVSNGTVIDGSGGGQVLVSPTIVGSPAKHLRVFALVAIPAAQSMRADDVVDRWRAGFGVIYSFDRTAAEAPPLAPPAATE